MPDLRQWYVVQTKPRREHYAQDQLGRRGVETFLPRILEPPRAGGEPVVGPLFPNYLFACLDIAAQYASVVWSPGVRQVVSFGDVPTPVDFDVVEFLRTRCGAEGVVVGPPRFRDGDWVRVRRGPLEGLVGTVEGQTNGQSRIRVLMELLRRQTRVDVPLELLEPASGPWLA